MVGVSIHLMLLFIRFCFSLRFCRTRFNTSHVTLYLCTANVRNVEGNVSIHLMLLFITVVDFGEVKKGSFNTSHVTLYRKGDVRKFYPSVFQYISCYSLSSGQADWQTVKNCFNTSHVTLYLQQRRSMIARGERFNTSHVTLYPKNRQKSKSKKARFNTSHVTLYLPLQYLQ